MLLEIKYIGNEYNEEPVENNDIKLMAVDRQTKQLIDNLTDSLSAVGYRVSALEADSGGCDDCPVFTAGFTEVPTRTVSESGALSTVTCDKTYAEVTAAIVAHKVINAWWVGLDVQNIPLHIIELHDDIDGEGVVFSISGTDDQEIVVYMSDGTIGYYDSSNPGGDGEI